jgi:hypothetical protein
VYSVLVGSGEPLTHHQIPPTDDYDRVLFTDRPTLSLDGWETRVLDSHDLGSARESRRPKLLPHRFLEEYEWSLYVDNNVVLTDACARWLAQCQRLPKTFYAFSHPWRTCAYEEAERVISVGYDDEKRVREQIDHYQSCGFPRDFGLVVGNVLLRRHNDPHLVQVLETWYEHILRYSKRDQISFPFVCWRHAYAWGEFEASIQDNPYVKYPARTRSERVTADFDESVYRWLNPEVEQSPLTPKEHFIAFRSERTRFKKHCWELRRLANKYRSDKGNLYYNAHGYADIYEKLLSPRRKEPLRMLEIGLLRHDVQAKNPDGPFGEAPSLSMWREYFQAAEIFGFDIADFSSVPKTERVTILRGDMGRLDDLRQMISDTGGSFDVIIDDGSHASHHQQIALAFLFDHLRSGGYYFIEDLHYQPKALEDPTLRMTTVEVLKRLEFGKIRPTKYLPREVLEKLKTEITHIKFYDSADRNFGRIRTDALVAIRKK